MLQGPRSRRVWTGVAATLSVVTLAGLAFLWGCSAGNGPRSVPPSGGGAAVQRAIARLGPEGGEIRLTAGSYLCKSPIIIDKSDVKLSGAGEATVLKLVDAANCPVLIVGDPAPDPRRAVHGVRLSDFEIDGNRESQKFECWDGLCDTGEKTSLRSCGILLRRAMSVMVERVAISRCRSAGCVTEKGCRRLTIRDLACSDNTFDGLACYETEDSVFAGLHLHDNKSAGFSADNGFNRNLVTQAIMVRNGGQGIFMRNSRNNVFDDFLILDSGQQGVLLAQNDDRPETGASGNTFVGAHIANSGGHAFRINDESCSQNLVSGAQFIGNKRGGLSERSSGLARLEASITR